MNGEYEPVVFVSMQWVAVRVGSIERPGFHG